ncbi:MAG: glycosyltransferase family 39 protein [Anaerolineaceae bacterium]
MGERSSSQTGKKKWLGVIALVLIMFVINFLLQIGYSPMFKPMYTDSGTFAYCGGRMAVGDVLYRDCWDNKPPLVYAINALIVLLGGHNPWSVWWFQMLWMTVTSVLFYVVVRSVWKQSLAAVWSTLLFLGTTLTPVYYTNGNITETYLLLPLVLTAGALYAYLNQGKGGWMLAAGLLTAAAALLKPTYIGMGAAAAVTALLFNLRRHSLTQGLKDIGLFALGFLVPLALVAFAWQQMGALNDLVYAVLKHNVGYVEAGLSWRSVRGTLAQFLKVQPMAGLFWLAFISSFIFGFLRIKQWGPDRNTWLPKEDVIAWWAAGTALAVPIQMISIGISGKNFGHYYLEVMPALALLAGAGVAAMSHRPQTYQFKKSVSIGLGTAVFALTVLWGRGAINQGVIEFKNLAQFARQPDVWTYHPSEVEQYILDHSQPDESVLIWATHIDIDFVTNRRSPTRYVFPKHVLAPTLTGISGFPELIDELRADPPRLIIQQVPSSSGLPAFTDRKEILCMDCSEDARQAMGALKEYILTHYHFSQQIYDWQIFERN